MSLGFVGGLVLHGGGDNGLRQDATNRMNGPRRSVDVRDGTDGPISRLDHRVAARGGADVKF
jgi:hypothetical protein